MLRVIFTQGKNLALLGAVDFPSKFLSYFALKFLKRRISTAFVLFLGGCCILINIFVPQDLPFEHLGIAMLGKGSVAIFLSISVIYSHELIPTGIRSRIEGVLILTNGMSSVLSSTVVVTKQYFEHLPKILCGTSPIVASIFTYFLPETFNLPLPDTLQDMKRRYKNYKDKSTKEEEIDNL